MTGHCRARGAAVICASARRVLARSSRSMMWLGFHGGEAGRTYIRWGAGESPCYLPEPETLSPAIVDRMTQMVHFANASAVFVDSSAAAVVLSPWRIKLSDSPGNGYTGMSPMGTVASASRDVIPGSSGVLACYFSLGLHESSKGGSKWDAARFRPRLEGDAEVCACSREHLTHCHAATQVAWISAECEPGGLRPADAQTASTRGLSRRTRNIPKS